MDPNEERKGIADPASLLRARKIGEDVKDMIASISDKLTKVSSHIEQEFLASYRVHMLSVQEELQDLRNQVQQAEAALKDDAEVSHLESEVTWFTDETTRLRNQSNAMKKDISHIASRIDALKEQKVYLSDQLKTTMKRTRILEAETDLLLESNSQWDGDYDDNKFASQEAYNQSIDMGRGKLLKSQSQPALTKNNTNGATKKQTLGKSPSVSMLPSVTTGNNINKKKKNKKNKSIQSSASSDVLLKTKGIQPVEMVKGTPHSVVLQAFKADRLNCELELEDAVKSVFEEIIDRKVESVSRHTSKKNLHQHDPSEHWKIGVSAGGLSGLGLRHFSDNDRLAAIATFVAKPKIFDYIVHQLNMELNHVA